MADRELQVAADNHVDSRAERRQRTADGVVLQVHIATSSKVALVIRVRLVDVGARKDRPRRELVLRRASEWVVVVSGCDLVLRERETETYAEQLQAGGMYGCK